jgi:hypothetical protein
MDEDAVETRLLAELHAAGRDCCARCGEPIERGLLSFGAIMCADCRSR